MRPYTIPVRRGGRDTPATATRDADRRDARSTFATAKGEAFKGIKKIQYEGPKSMNPLAFKYYKEDEGERGGGRAGARGARGRCAAHAPPPPPPPPPPTVVLGKPMKEWLRFGVW